MFFGKRYNKFFFRVLLSINLVIHYMPQLATFFVVGWGLFFFKKIVRLYFYEHL